MDIYASKHYKLLLLIPVIVFLTALYFSAQVEYGIDLKGGVLIMASVEKDVDASALQEKMSSYFEFEGLKVRKTGGASEGVYIEFMGEKNLLEAANALEAKNYDEVILISKQFTGELNIDHLPAEDKADAYFAQAREKFKNDLVAFLSLELEILPSALSIQDVGPSLGEFFLSQAKTAIVLAFLFISLIIFYYFRNIVLSFAAVQSAVFDIIVAYAALGMFGIPLSLATIAPLLMIIGYSIDTDIMLIDRVVKRKEGTVHERLRGALQTGLTMTLTTIFTMLGLLAISYYANITVLFNISLILFIGLLGDLVATWCTNSTLILWFMERKEKKVKK